MAATRLLVAVMALGFVALAQASSDPTIKLDGVHDLTPETFSTFVNGGKAALVEFYAPWCGHCKRLVPEYKKLGELIQTNPKLRGRVVVAKVDADKHRSLGELFGVRGFPTIMHFPRGKRPDKSTGAVYAGARTAEAFVQFLEDDLAGDPGVGKVEALQPLVAGFATAADKAAIIKQVEAKVGELTGEEASLGQLYVKVLTKAAEKGADYLKTEAARVEKLLSSGAVSLARVDEMARKLSVHRAIISAGDEAAADAEL